jgi:hypothetical protein
MARDPVLVDLQRSNPQSPPPNPRHTGAVD